MNNSAVNQLVHVLAIVAGVLTIVAGALTQPPFSVPALIPATMGVVVTVLVYVSNQIPALGTAAQPAPEK